MKKVYLLLAACLIVTVIAFSGCRRPAPTAQTSRDVLVVAMPSMPPHLDPVLTNDMPSARMHNTIYDTLLNFDYDMSITPGLAERWTWEDPTRLRVFLKRNVRFHNGDTFRASDVKFSLERAAQSPHVGHITGMIQRVDVVNDNEAVINLNFPFAPFLNHLAHTATSIVNERAVRELGDDRHTLAPVGTGPYRVTNYVAGNRVELTRWDNYHGTAAHIKDLTIRAIGDQQTRLLELETGGIDIYLDLQNAPHDVARVENHANLTALRGMSLSTNFISFNCQRPPFNDARVRQAISHALDLDAMVRTVWHGIGSSGRGPINSAVWASIANQLPRYDYNPARARQLLADAGYPNGFSTAIYVNEGNNARIDTAEIAQNMLAQVGIRADVRIVEWGAYLDLTARGEHEMFILGWVTVTGDPDYGLHATHHTESFGAAGNRSFYSNPDVDRLLDQGRRETNPAQRQEIYAQVQRMIHADAPWVYWYVGENVVGTRSDVRGFRMHPADYWRLWEVYYE